MKIPPRVVTYLQVLPLTLVLLLFLGIPLLIVIVVSFFDYDQFDIIPDFTLLNYIELLQSELTQLGQRPSEEIPEFLREPVPIACRNRDQINLLFKRNATNLGGRIAVNKHQIHFHAIEQRISQQLFGARS